MFDGFSDIAVNSSEVITVSGFVTRRPAPSTPGSNILAYEGDRGATGDSAFLNATRMATASSPGTNFFNGTNDLDGRSVTTRTPADDNMLGFDIMRTGVPDAIPNGATNATDHRQHDERALLRRLVRHPDRRVRPRLLDEHEDVDEPRRAHAGAAR